MSQLENELSCLIYYLGKARAKLSEPNEADIYLQNCLRSVKEIKRIVDSNNTGVKIENFQTHNIVLDISG